MFFSIFIHSEYFFQTITQSFYIALSHINIRMRNKISAAVLIIAAGALEKNQKFFPKKTHSA